MKTVLFFRPKKNDHFKEDEVIHSSHHVIPGDKPDRFFADLPHMNDVSSECEVRLTKRIDEFVSYVLNSASGTEDEIRSLKLLVTPFVGELLHAIGVNYRLISSIDKCYSEKVFAVIEWDHYRPKTMVEFVHMARKGSVVNSNIQNLLFKYVFTGLRCCYYSGNEFDMYRYESPSQLRLNNIKDKIVGFFLSAYNFFVSLFPKKGVVFVSLGLKTIFRMVFNVKHPLHVVNYDALMFGARYYKFNYCNVRVPDTDPICMVFRDLFESLFPRSLSEVREVVTPYIRSCDHMLSAGSMTTSDAEILTAASLIYSGNNLFDVYSYQHGGDYFVIKDHKSRLIEESYSNAMYVWNKKASSKVGGGVYEASPLLRRSCFDRISVRNIKRIIIIYVLTDPRQYNNYPGGCLTNSSESLNELSNEASFLKWISDNENMDLYIKEYPGSSFPYQNIFNSCNIKAVYGCVPIVGLFSIGGVVVYNHLSTGWLESLSNDRPFVVLISPFYSRNFSHDFVDVVSSQSNTPIIHQSHASLESFFRTIVTKKQLEKWWESDDTVRIKTVLSELYI